MTKSGSMRATLSFICSIYMLPKGKEEERGMHLAGGGDMSVSRGV
jgi:hypothetical protein